MPTTTPKPPSAAKALGGTPMKGTSPMHDRPIVTFDLDSTLCDTRHRHHMIKREGGTDWKAYALAHQDDALVPAAAALWRVLERSAEVWVVSGRSEAAAVSTRAWLADHGLRPAGLALMPPLLEHLDHGTYKRRQIEAIRELTGRPVVLHVDDWPPVQVALEPIGVPVLVVQSPQMLAAFDTDSHLTFV